MKSIAIVVLNYNTPEMTEQLATYLVEKLDYPEKHVYVVDNGSTPLLADSLPARPGLTLISLRENAGFTRGMQAAYEDISQRAEYDAYWFLNSDVLFDYGDRVLADLVDVLFADDAFAQIAPQHNSPHAHMNQAASAAQEVAFLEPTATLVKASTIVKLGFWDTDFTLGWGVDFDYGWRVREAGMKNILTDRARIMHREHSSQTDRADYARRAETEMVRVLRQKYGANWMRIIVPPPAPPAAELPAIQGNAGKMPLAVCAIFRNEARYLKEWIEFHRVVGVEKFYLYENRSTDAWQPVLAPYIAQGLVDVAPWPQPGSAQMPAYRDCFQRLRGQKLWLAVIDIDEFLFSPKFPTVPEALATLPGRWGAVGVHWIVFGASGQEQYAPELVMERFTWRPCDGFHVNAHIKSILRMDREVGLRGDAHLFQVQGRTYSETGRLLSNARPPGDETSLLRINHYCTKSREEYYDRIALGRVDGQGIVAQSMFEERQDQDFDDRTIWKFLPELKRRMAAEEV